MSKVVPLPPPQDGAQGAPADQRAVEQMLSLAKTLIEALPQAEKERLLREVADQVRASSRPGPRSGEVLGTIVQFLPQRKTWSAAEVKRFVDERGVSASPKEVYNAIHYLARRGSVSRIGYGLYRVNNMVVSTSDDFGGEPSRFEGGPDD